METNESILERFESSFEPHRQHLPIGNPLWRELSSSPKKVAVRSDTGNLFFDPVLGHYVDEVTGICYSAEDVLDSPEKTSRIKSRKQLTFDEWCDSLRELALEGKVQHSEGWKRNYPNPDTEIGQTVPWSEHQYESVTHDGISQTLPLNEEAKRVANCAEIEHINHPLKTEGVGDDIHAEFSSLDTPEETVFEAINCLASRLKKSPGAKYWKWLPTMIDFLADHINLHDGTGEISIPDLLSAFKTIRREKQDLLHLMKVNFEQLVKAQQKVKQLRTQMYGHRKHMNFQRK